MPCLSIKAAQIRTLQRCYSDRALTVCDERHDTERSTAEHFSFEQYKLDSA